VTSIVLQADDQVPAVGIGEGKLFPDLAADRGHRPGPLLAGGTVERELELPKPSALAENAPLVGSAACQN
jgi:hypothetical protein